MITTITMIMNAKAMVMAFAMYIITMQAAVLMEEIAAVLMSPVWNSLQILNLNLNHLMNPFSLTTCHFLNFLIGMQIQLGEDKKDVDYQNMQRISIVIWKITMQIVIGMVELVVEMNLHGGIITANLTANV